MSNKVRFSDAKLWKNKHEGRNGDWYSFSVSVSRKMQDGSYSNKGLKVYTSKENAIPSDVPNGALVDIDGFLTLDVYEGRNGTVKEVAVFAEKVLFKDDDNDSYEELDEDIPF